MLFGFDLVLHLMVNGELRGTCHSSSMVKL